MKISQFYISATVGDSGFVPIDCVRLTPEAACKLNEEKFLVFAEDVAQIAYKCRMSRLQLILPGYERRLGVHLARPSL